MKYQPNILNPDQDAEFDAAMDHWQRELNLEDWRIERGRRVPVKAMATVTVDYSARLAKYRTGDFGSAETNSASISLTALHESIHVLLYELLHLTSIGADAGVLESAEHRVVTTLEKIIMKALG